MNIPEAVSSLVSLGGIQIDTVGGFALVNRLLDNELLVDGPLIKNVIKENIILDAATPVLDESLIFSDGSTELEADGTEKELIISHDTDQDLVDAGNDPGIEYYVSYGIEFSEVPTCTLTKSDDTAASDTLRFCEIERLSLEYTVLKFAITVGGTSDLFAATAAKSRFKV